MLIGASALLTWLVFRHIEQSTYVDWGICFTYLACIQAHRTGHVCWLGHQLDSLGLYSGIEQNTNLDWGISFTYLACTQAHRTAHVCWLGHQLYNAGNIGACHMHLRWNGRTLRASLAWSLVFPLSIVPENKTTILKSHVRDMTKSCHVCTWDHTVELLVYVTFHASVVHQACRENLEFEFRIA